MTTFRHHDPTNTSEHELAAHHNQGCAVVRELGNDRRDAEVGPMFLVRFADGYEADLHADELHPAPTSTTLRNDPELGWVELS